MLEMEIDEQCPEEESQETMQLLPEAKKTSGFHLLRSSVRALTLVCAIALFVFWRRYMQ